MIRAHWPASLGLCLSVLPVIGMAQDKPSTEPKASFTIFGAANVQYESVSATGAATPSADRPSRNRFSNVSSDLGFRGAMPVSSTMTAQFQYVTGINVDNAASGLIGGAKDSFVGLSFANVGIVKLGRLSGAARWNSGTADFSPAGAGPQDDQAMLSLASGQTGLAPQFNSRLDNAIGFETVRWNGLSLRAYYSANEGRSNAAVATGARLSDGSVSLGVQYVWKDLDLRLSVEQRDDKGTLNNSTTNNTRDRDYRFGVRYRVLPTTQLAFGLDHMNFIDTTATGSAKSALSRRGWVLGARHQSGDHVVYGGFGKAANVRCTLANGAVCNGDDTGGRQWVLAYNHLLTKQMLVEVFVTQLTNQSRARYDFDAGGVSPAVGADPKAFGVGLRYTF